jgi:CRISPR/Cas system-associated exonuclease Cas4 (RecB family)
VGFTPQLSLVDWILGSRGRNCGDPPRIMAWELSGPGEVWPSDLAVPCPTGRAVWLRRRALIQKSTPQMTAGTESHREALRVWRTAITSGLEGLLGVAREGFRGLAGLWAAGRALRWLSLGGVPPASVEPRLEGWAGYAGGKPDLLLGPYPVELADTEPGSPYWARKRIVVAAYALMLEHMTGHPVVAGYLVSLRTGEVERVCVDDKLRSQAVMEAERLAAALAGDPGLPPEGPRACPATCPFYRECWGAGVDIERGEARLGVEA